MGGPLRAPHPLSSVPSCKQNQDMLSFYAIVIGLNNAAISRLRLTWEVRGPGPPLGASRPPGCSGTPRVFLDPPLKVLTPPGFVLQKLPGKFKNLFRKFENLTVRGAHGVWGPPGGVWGSGGQRVCSHAVPGCL